MKIIFYLMVIVVSFQVLAIPLSQMDTPQIIIPKQEASLPKESLQPVRLSIITQEFFLDNNSIARAELVEENGRYLGLAIHLKEKYAKDFTQLTQSNLNKKLQFSMGKKIISVTNLSGALGDTFLISDVPKTLAQEFLETLSIIDKQTHLN